MSPPSLIVAAFLLALVVMSYSFMGGAVIVAVPLALVGLAVIGALDFNRRRKEAGSIQDFQDQAKSGKIEFSKRDQATLTSE